MHNTSHSDDEYARGESAFRVFLSATPICARLLSFLQILLYHSTSHVVPNNAVNKDTCAF